MHRYMKTIPRRSLFLYTFLDIAELACLYGDCFHTVQNGHWRTDEDW
jgi:hypothetical protein